MTEQIPEPNLKDGIEYWNSQPASYDGVLGGFGTGTLPRIDALGSRQFLLYLRPDFCSVPSAIRPLNQPVNPGRTRALDVGAGVGRVTCDVLLPLVSDVWLLEPVEAFIQEAAAGGHINVRPPGHGSNAGLPWKGIHEQTKSVTFAQGTLQAFDPSHPQQSLVKSLGRIGYIPPEVADDTATGFDVIWCQWCLGHLNDTDLVAFFERSRVALRRPDGLVVVKENLCSEPEGEARTVFDEQDSSLTRSDLAWKKLFKDAGLRLVREQVQEGLPEGLYAVKMYALR